MPRVTDVLERESRTVDLEPGDFQRLLGRRERRQRSRRIRAGALGVVVTLALGTFFARSLMTAEVPADRPEPTPALTGVSGALAYALDGDVYLADPNGSNAVMIPDGIPDAGCEGRSGETYLSWSPDGRYLAFQRDCPSSEHDDIVITDPFGNAVAEFPTYGGGWGFTWSPDSTRIAVWEPALTIGVYGVDGEQQASLPVPAVTGGGNSDGPGWMPDGSALLLFGYAVVPLDGSPAHELSLDGYPIYSPDGTHVAVLGDRATFITDADGALVAEVDVPLHDAVWSPDGARFASVSPRYELVVVDAASGEVTVVTEDVNVVRGFSPRGDRILFADLVRDGGAVYNSLYSIGVDGSDVRLLVDGAMQGQWRPR